MRLAASGSNTLTSAPERRWWIGLAAQFNQLVIWILIAAALISGLLSDWTDSAAILAIVALNALLGYFQEERAAAALESLRNLTSPTARVLRDGQLATVSACDVVPGDILQLESGDRVPADARLITSFTLKAQESTLTGESAPVEKRARDVLPVATPLADRSNQVFQGSTIATGKGTAVVTSTGMQTELGRIAGMLQHVPPEPTPLQRRLSELGRVLIGACLGLVTIISVLQIVRGDPLVSVLVFSVSLGVAAVPEGLPAVVTISLALGLQRMARRHALIRKLPSVETLGSVTVICTDKTGTLTRNEMTVREIHVGPSLYSVSGTGFDPRGEFHLIGESSPPQDAFADGSDDLRKALVIGALCNGARVARQPAGSGDWQVYGDPTDGALIVAAMKYGVDVELARPHVVHEVPFDTERKTMSIVHQDSEGHVELFTKGAPEVVIRHCTWERFAGQVVPLTNERREVMISAAGEMAGRALRVLALAYDDEGPTNPEDVEEYGFLERGLVLAGLVGMIDPPREEVKEAVAKCQTAGVRVVMITGDHPATALAIARELKIARSRDDVAITGNELDAMGDEELSNRVARAAVFARVTAEHKLRIVKAWKRCSAIVAMTGDGVNDAPAIRAADIGIAMGLTGTDVTKEASDMVLTDDNFTSIVSAVEEGRGIFDNIQKVVHYLLATNIGEVLFIFFSTLVDWPIPLRPTQLLWINLVTDGLPALALTVEPTESGSMSQPPRSAQEPVITWHEGLTILFHGSIIAATSALAFHVTYQGDPQSLNNARTTAFCVLTFSQLLFALACRSRRLVWPRLGFFSNPGLVLAIVASMALQLIIVLVPVLRPWLGITSEPQVDWVLVLVLAMVPATLIEAVKLFRSGWTVNR